MIKSLHDLERGVCMGFGLFLDALFASFPPRPGAFELVVILSLFFFSRVRKNCSFDY